MLVKVFKIRAYVSYRIMEKETDTSRAGCLKTVSWSLPWSWRKEKDENFSINSWKIFLVKSVHDIVCVCVCVWSGKSGKSYFSFYIIRESSDRIPV